LNIAEDQKKSLIFISVLILIVLIDFIFFMRPQLNILKSINPQLTNVIRDVKSAKFDIKQKSNFKKRYEMAQAKITRLDKQIPRDEEISLILDEISVISKESRVKITQLKPLKENSEIALEADTGVYYKLPIYIDAFCGYHQFGMFLNKIEYSDIFMKATEIEMVQNKVDSRNHQVRLVIDAFVIKK